MRKSTLIKAHEKYYKNVSEWFIDELAKWSKKHNMYIQDYTIVRLWVIGSDNAHEPYSHHRDNERDIEFKDAVADLEEIMDGLDELGINTWQGLEYSDKAKFLH